MNHHTDTGRAARSMRESCGTFLTPEAFGIERNPNPDKPVIVGSLLIAGVFFGLWAGGALVDRAARMNTYELRAHQCTPIDSLASDRTTMLWHCADGYRTSDVAVVDGS